MKAPIDYILCEKDYFYYRFTVIAVGSWIGDVVSNPEGAC